MRLAGVLLVFLLIAKDASFLGDRYVMRALSQGLCGAVGALWIVGHIQLIAWPRYLLLLAYFVVLIITAFFSPYSQEALLQVVSLGTVLVFAVSATESTLREQIVRAVMTSTFACYALVCAVSLVLYKVAPHLVFQIGDIAGERRFSGVYGRPAMLGASSGILIGIALFHSFSSSRVVLILRLAGAVLGLVCLWLSGARTFWVGFLCALPAVAFLKFESRSKLVIASFAASIVIALCAQLFTLTLSKETKEETLRVDSVSTLTGRTAIWEGTFRILQERPFLGFGFGVSGLGIAKKADESAYLVEERARNAGTAPTLHNGYVQAFGDSGLIGGFLYCALIIAALFRCVKRSFAKAHAAEAFVLVFLAVANFAESIVFKASVWHSALFWFLLVYAWGARPTVTSVALKSDKPIYSNLLRG